MTVFDFSHFPEESELISDIAYALQMQCENNAVEKVKAGILDACRTLKDYNETDWEIDCEGMAILDALSRGERSLEALDEEQRELLAVLWVNYMCDKPRGEIVASVGEILRSGKDYKTASMQMIRRQLQEDMHDESSRLGAALYLWTLVCVTRAVTQALEMWSPQAARPPMFGGISLN